MKLRQIIFIIILIVLSQSSIVSYAQTEYGSTEEMAAGAQKLFEEEKYIEAFPLYSQLLSLDNTNAELNYRFGVCLLYADRSDTYAPIKYLKKAMNQIPDPDLYYHLGFAYHINYYFPAAVSHYKEYQTKAGSKAKKSFEVDRKIEMCQNGMKMMRSVKDLFVLQKSEVARSEFFRSYNLDDFGSKIIKKPEDFLNKEDKKRNDKDFIFFSPKAKDIYYSSLSGGSNKQKDIFVRHKLPEGKWSGAEKLPSVINTSYDEDFPVMMPDGKTLYFSSKGHTTIGGYDIFKSVYNPQTKIWSVPENINFPFNTPLDDILFVSDTLESTAWFASVRNSIQDKITVYKVGIIKRPEGSVDLAAIYAKNQALTEEDMRQIKLRAQLDVNISYEEYIDIPVVVEEPVAIMETPTMKGEAILAAELVSKQQEQAVIDSAKSLVIQLEDNMDVFDSVRQTVMSLASVKRKEAERLREDVSRNMGFAAQTTELSTLQKLTDESNLAMGTAEKMDYEAGELDAFARQINETINQQHLLFTAINTQYGDAEAAIIQGDKEKAMTIIDQMNNELQELPQLPDLQKTFDIQKGGLVDVQYPSSIKNPDEFVAFVISNDKQSAPSIESFSSNYDEYLPQDENAALHNQEEFAGISPLEKIEQYTDELNQQSLSIDIQIAEQQEEIDRVKSEFTQLPASEKEEQLEYLNILEEEKAMNEANAHLARETTRKLNADYMEELQSSATPEEKQASYLLMTQATEEVFDFKKKVFIASETKAINLTLAPVIATTAYQINNQGQLVEVPKEPLKIIPADDMSFEEKNAEIIMAQMTEMESQLRASTEQNNFAVKKVQVRIDVLDEEAQTAFKQANSLVASAKSAKTNKREDIIDQANYQFNLARDKKNEADELRSISQQISSADEASQELIQKMSINSDQLNTAANSNNWQEVESIYAQSQEAFTLQSDAIDFTEQVDLESGELINAEAVEEAPIMAYQLSNKGKVEKSFGNSNSTWKNLDSFTEDIAEQYSENSLGLSPSMKLDSKQDSFIEIFTPSKEFQGKSIKLSVIVIPESILASSNFLVQKTQQKVQTLEAEADELSMKRNAINEYYQKSIQEAAILERESITLLEKDIITVEDVEEANRKSANYTALLYKAAQAANLINEFDARLLSQALVISKGLNTAEQIETLFAENNSDDALLLNGQFQNEISNLHQQVVDDDQFNYAKGEIIITTPPIFSLEENQEYILEDGMVQRNSRDNIYEFFNENVSRTAVDFSVSPLIVASGSVVFTGQSKLIAKTEEIPNTGVLENENPSQKNTLDQTPDQSQDQLIAQTPITAQTPIQTTDQTQINDLVQPEAQIAVLPESDNQDNSTSLNEDSTALLIKPNNESALIIDEPVDIQVYTADEYSSVGDFDHALDELNAYSIAHNTSIKKVANALVILAEEKLVLSNTKSFEAGSSTDLTKKKNLEEESKEYLYEALALKSLAENYDAYVSEELAKQEIIAETTIQIDLKLSDNNLPESKQLFKSMQKQVGQFGEASTQALRVMQEQMISEGEKLSHQMDSAFLVSQELANESVKLLSEASEERTEAEGKKNAFKRRKHLTKAEEMEIRATEIQNQSEKALALGNDLYYRKQVVASLGALSEDFKNIENIPYSSNPLIVNQTIVFSGIEMRKQEEVDGHLSTTIQETPAANSRTPLAVTDDIHVYEREIFKAQIITEELELIKREIALLTSTDKSNLSDREIYVIEKQVKALRTKTDSIEYQANKAFEFANSVLATLSEEDQKKAKEKGRDFNDYLQDLKDRIELLLSEASALKQRAIRSNNLANREDLYEQAKEKEEVAMYLILEEFEVIAQKNKTRYRKNQLVLQQMLMESASLQERDMMMNIFAQIDSYFEESQQKREKANGAGISFKMRKILLQDAYSLEMKALDLQQQAKTMLENHDTQAMLAYQLEGKEGAIAIEVAADNTKTTASNSRNNQGNIAEREGQANNKPSTDRTVEQEVAFTKPDQGTVYKVQFSALQEIKPVSFFSKISEITAQRVPNTNFIRYFSGNFNSLDAAMIRRNTVRASGYPDAFIKSWKNGEEVSLLSLRENSQNASVKLSAGSASQSVVNNIDFSATNISYLQGVYYSVQVGVYSRPRTSAMIHGVTPLYHKRMKNGYWVYYSGIYKTIEDASNRRDEIVIKGVKDAFIVAFSDGKTVSFAQARQDIDRGSDTPADEDIVILEDASLQIDSQWNIAQVSEASLSETDKEIVYKIQIGVYSNSINMDWISSQLDGDMELESFQNSNSKYVFTLGSFSSIDAARAELEKVKEIVPDAFVVGFRGANKVYVR